MMTAREFIEMEPKKNWREDPGAAKEFVANSKNWRDKPGVKMRTSETSAPAGELPSQTVHVAEGRVYRLLHGRVRCTGCGAHEKNEWHPARAWGERASDTVWVKSWVQYEDRGEDENIFGNGKGFMLDVTLVCKTLECQRTGNLQIRPDPLMGDSDFFEQKIDTYRIVKDGE